MRTVILPAEDFDAVKERKKPKQKDQLSRKVSGEALEAQVSNTKGIEESGAVDQNLGGVKSKPMDQDTATILSTYDQQM